MISKLKMNNNLIIFQLNYLRKSSRNHRRLIKIIILNCFVYVLFIFLILLFYIYNFDQDNTFITNSLKEINKNKCIEHDNYLIFITYNFERKFYFEINNG